MKTSTLKKSLLDYAIKGSLSSRFRRENPNLNALSEIQAYNENIAKQRKTLQKGIQKLEKELDSIKQQKQESKEQKEQKKEVKENLKKQIRELEKQRQNLKTIQILEPPHYESSSRHSEGVQRTTEESKIQESKEILKDISGLSPQYDALSPHYDNSTFTPPFSIPPTWVWVRLGDICEVSDGTHITPRYTDKGIPFLSVKNISKGYFDLNDVKYIDYKTHLKLTERSKPENGDILICRIGTLGKAITINLDFEFSIFVSLGLLKPKLTLISNYLAFYLNSNVMDIWIGENRVGGGTHAAKLNLNSLNECLIPLPPLKEQEFLAKKLDELVSLATDFDNTKEELKRKRG